MQEDGQGIAEEEWTAMAAASRAVALKLKVIMLLKTSTWSRAMKNQR